MKNLLVILLVMLSFTAFSENSDNIIVLNNGDTIFSEYYVFREKRGYMYYAKKNKEKPYKVAFTDVKYFKLKGVIHIPYYRNEKKISFCAIHAFNDKYILSGFWYTPDTGGRSYRVLIRSRENFKKVQNLLFVPGDAKSRFEKINEFIVKLFPNCPDLIKKLISNINSDKHVFKDVNYYNCGDSPGFIKELDN